MVSGSGLIGFVILNQFRVWTGSGFSLLTTFGFGFKPFGFSGFRVFKNFQNSEEILFYFDDFAYLNHKKYHFKCQVHIWFTIFFKKSKDLSLIAIKWDNYVKEAKSDYFSYLEYCRNSNSFHKLMKSIFSNLFNKLCNCLHNLNCRNRSWKYQFGTYCY